jgi:RIO-like serine/threonine protein kinase
VDGAVFTNHGGGQKVSTGFDFTDCSQLVPTLTRYLFLLAHRLYHGARLVHGDLNESNILVCPARLVENRDEGFGSDDDNELQAVLIDFGQAVDWQHPASLELLEHDLTNIREFFLKKSVKTLTTNMALEFVTAPEPDNEDASSSALDAEDSRSKMHTSGPGVTVVRMFCRRLGLSESGSIHDVVNRLNAYTEK